ncbi:MAG TPA: DUF2889 domain-containing protein [Acidimicrobiales bacterium]|jgi:hypothetical protein|nr:DUF2889 domain-containing protein [Acidimicrobiales bacterium]
MNGASPDSPRVPLHVRSIEYQAFDEGDQLTIVGRLRDTRPWAAEGSAVHRLHDMELRVTVRVEDLTITESDAVMHIFPHSECPGIVAAFRALAGLQVGRGYTREVQNRFGGPKGCTHLEHLARSLGPVVVQSVTSKRALANSRGEVQEVITDTGTPWVRNTCHIWSEGGVGDQKLAAGWRPGIGVYPSPPLEEITEGGRVDSSDQ